MKYFHLTYTLCLVSLVYSTEFQFIDLFKENYSSYLQQVEKDVSQIKFIYSNKDIYAIQDIVNTTIYTDVRIKMKKLDTWVYRQNIQISQYHPHVSLRKPNKRR